MGDVVGQTVGLPAVASAWFTAERVRSVGGIQTIPANARAPWREAAVVTIGDCP